MVLLVKKATFFNYEGEPNRAYEVLEEVRSLLAKDDFLARDALCTVVFCQGVTALRRGETDNCVMCRGEGSCILPIAPAAIHTYDTGSRLAIRHFTEYLDKFPEDQGARWLLNVAHMTCWASIPPRSIPGFSSRSTTTSNPSSTSANSVTSAI